MARMTVRSTYALDEQTSQRIKQLAKHWHVSQAEVIRRSVKVAEEQSVQTLTPADVVKRYAEGPQLRSKTQTREMIRSLRKWRHEDDTRRAGSDTP